MSSNAYFGEIEKLVGRLGSQETVIAKAAEKCAAAIKSGNWVRLFGSGHSVLPTMDCFPRYGGYEGWNPIMDPRLMWTTVSGLGGAEEVIWLERQEGYADLLLRHNKWNPEDVLIIFSHGGQNAAPVEIAQAAKKDGLYVIALTSMENHKNRPATHSSKKKIGDIADLIIDNCVAPEDAVVSVPKVAGKVGGTSTIAACILIQALVAETALVLAKQGYLVKPFASPNTIGISKQNNAEVYEGFRARLRATDARR
jgi:uncharacterized phosphosugar-binding protein